MTPTTMLPLVAASLLPLTAEYTPYPSPPLVSSAKVVFVGGINSTGSKGWQLANDGYEVSVPKMPSHNFTAITAKFLPHCLTGVRSYLNELRSICLNCTKGNVPDIVVGSSQGGAVAMSLVQNEWKGAKLCLIAPAWRTYGVDPVVPKDTSILHGTNDWVVNLSDSVNLRNRNKCRLVKVNDSHALGESYNKILREVDALSVLTGKHKPQEVINKEWQEYKEACEKWLNCTKKPVTKTGPSKLEAVDGKLW